MAECMNKRRLFEQLKKNPRNVRFQTLCKAARAFGFKFKGGKGSYRVYVHDDIGEILNFQNVDGKGKPYQVKQFINIVEKYNLEEDD